MMKKYGVNHNSKMDGFKEKIKKTKLEKYGAKYKVLKHCNNNWPNALHQTLVI
jgi:hypothetical protein